MSLGDRAVGSTLNFKFNVTNSSGVPTTLTGTPAIACYKNNSTAESTAGLTLTVDFDGKTGLCNVTIDTSADSSFYAADSDFEIILTAGTVGAVDVSGTVVGHFSLAKCTANADVKKIAGTTVLATAGVLDVRLADGVPHGGTTARLRLGSSTSTPALYVTSTGGISTQFESSAFNCAGLRCKGGERGSGADFLGGNGGGTSPDGGTVVSIYGGYSSEGGNGGSGLDIEAGDNNCHGIIVFGGNGTGGNAIWLNTSAGDTISINPTGGDGVNIIANGFGNHDINLAGSGDILGNLTGTINGLTAAGLATLFTVNSTKVYADAVNGSPVKEIGNILNRVMTESYAADGAAMTPAQALYEICQLLEERTISGTTLTIKKRDGVTTAFELTLDAVPPTTQTRSS